ncbi:MAG: insulinase family protein [Candidatus Aminicenantes bacterium]|nr:insulinase family protein [Candidatus Aminicenantes bacterium]
MILNRGVRAGLLVFWAFGLAAAQASQAETGFPFPFSRYTLDNGLQVVLSEDDSLPLVSVALAYRAGYLYEQPGKTGLAHLIENLMFLGSQNVGPLQHISYINRVGGETNANTTEDLTFFYQTVPANQLALVLWLESDRMNTLEIDAARMERAKQALLDGIVQRKAAEPYLESQIVFDSLLYPDFAHGHGILGREEDIFRLTVEDARAFYETHFTPNNAVLSVVGNINFTQTKEMVERFFETISPGKKLPVFLPPRPPEKEGVVESLIEPLAPSPAFHLGYRIAPPYSRDYFALAILDFLLFKGQSSRLQKKLVTKEGLALYLTGRVEKRKDVAVMKLFAMNNNQTMVEMTQRSISSEFSRLRTVDVSSDELARAKHMFKRDYLNRLASPLDRALFLAEMVFSPPGLEGLPELLGKYMRVSPYEIRAAANRYLVPETSVLLNVNSR